MDASPQQRFTATSRRGYNKDFLNQICGCGCTRTAHKNKAGECTCGCPSFSPTGQVAHRPPVVPAQYALGTIPITATPRELPNGLREIPLPAPAPAEPAGPPGVLVPREGSASRCPFCHADDFESIPALKCASCKAWQHAACVQEHEKCGACNESWPA